jgi:putative Mg2+ transporter-C (MgtC) family protein
MLTTDAAVLRLFFAVLFGSIVGIERELTHKSAGLRTHILVCLGSTVFTLLSISPLIPGFQGDPGRIAAQIVTGIGFIGGGSVLRMGNSIQGLTTAASLWVIAAIGMLTGVGHLRIAAVATLLAFLVLFTIGNIEKTFLNKARKNQYRLKLEVNIPVEQAETLKLTLATALDNTTSNPQMTETWHAEQNRITLLWLSASESPPDVNDLMGRLAQFPGLQVVTCRVFYQPEAMAQAMLTEVD